MTGDELRRILQYAVQIQIAGGRVEVLTREDKQDLIALLRQWIAENEDPLIPV